jgi:hypothetical protein
MPSETGLLLESMLMPQTSICFACGGALAEGRMPIGDGFYVCSDECLELARTERVVTIG